MVYITKYNSDKIIKEVDVDSLNIEGEVYKKPIYFLSDYEKKYLLAVKSLLFDPFYFIEHYYKKYPRKIDSLYWVFEGNKPAYHNDKNCTRITSRYENYIIPDLIREQGESEVYKFRKWFRENKHLIPNSIEFNKKLELDWDIYLPLESKSGISSGSVELGNYNLDTITYEIDKLIRQAGRLYHKDLKYKRILGRFNKLTFLAYKTEAIYNNNTGYSDREVKTILREFDEQVKKPITSLLTNYYRVSLNPELEFEGDLLEELGFTPCQTCHDSFETQPTGYKASGTINTKKIESKKSKSIQGTTLEETYNLVLKGNSIISIARKRSLKESTIIQHIQQLLEIKPTQHFSHYKPNDSLLRRVRRAYLNSPEPGKLKPIYESLNEEVSYDDIRLALMFL